MPPQMGPDGSLPSLNNLYKTQLCKHFQQTKHCHVGNKCHFAHGENELRKKEDVSIMTLLLSKFEESSTSLILDIYFRAFYWFSWFQLYSFYSPFPSMSKWKCSTFRTITSKLRTANTFSIQRTLGSASLERTALTHTERPTWGTHTRMWTWQTLLETIMGSMDMIPQLRFHPLRTLLSRTRVVERCPRVIWFNLDRSLPR